MPSYTNPGFSSDSSTAGAWGQPKKQTYYASDAWNNTNKQAASPWGNSASVQPTYSTNPVRTATTTTSNPAPPVGTPMGQQPGTPTPGSGMSPGYGVGNDYWNPGNQGSQAQGAEPFLGYGFDWKTATPEQLAAFTQMQPWEQMKQNSYQYGQDFNENQRRWNEQFGWTQSNDTFNQNLASQQQASAQQIAQWQQQNWGQQFGLDSELGRAAAELGQRNASIQDWYNRNNAFTNQYSAESERQYQTRLIGVQQEANTIDQMWKSGQLTNQQRELALGELTQKQNEAYRYSAMAQEGALTREGYANQKQLANINAFGRAQTPRSRWIRSW